MGWRYAVGGLGLSVVASAAALVLWLASPTSPGSAMEQMARALDRVTSYTYRMESVYVSRKDDGRKVRDVVIGRWRAEPVGLHATIHIVETLGTNTTPGAPRALVDLEETYRAGGRGIVIDHLKKEYWWIDEEIDAASIPGGSPQVVIYKVRQRRGRVLRDLGVKKIDGRDARGLEILLDGTDPASDLGPATPESDVGQAAGWDWRNVKVEAWVDPKTNLPIEFHCTRRGGDFETNYRFTDLRWNVEFAPDAFDAVAPEGYAEPEKSPWSESTSCR
ncbi:MAG: hypothetical protein ACC628_22310 [Pirellulaceae bacterium]